VTAHVSAPLCAGAKRELAEAGNRAGDVRVRAVCADDVGADGSRLAAIGAAARSVSEDSASVAYIGTPDPIAVRFSEPILEEAGIARISTSSGAPGIRTLLKALRRADTSGSVRETVYDKLR
jgi:hypothetical protein